MNGDGFERAPDSTQIRDRANDAQREASDPAVSAFVSASAGSGKTKLLTDRLLRLMLGGAGEGSGADPARIQCLTFTKAAAAEMALRLQRTLGAWVTLPDAGLDARLADLAVVPTAAKRREARALFARVLDLPGGMRIGTIHAFCQSLLRRFPLEARLSPHFQLVDDVEAAATLRRAREDMLAGAHSAPRRAALEALAGIASLDQFSLLVQALQTDRARLSALLALSPEALLAAMRRVAGAPAEEPDGSVWDDGETRRALQAIAAKGSPVIAKKALGLLDWLALPPDTRAECWDSWTAGFLLPDGSARGMGALINTKLAEAQPHLAASLAAEQARLLALADARRARQMAAISAALVQLAGPVAQGYAQRKQAAGWLDYDDLIRHTSDLLVDPGSAWVLFKLDGGLDHLLLDEVQDTAPAQWEIAGRLTEEFFAGQGARQGAQHGAQQGGAPRTVFAVGDHKQSIFSFQGADPAAFDHWRGVLGRRVTGAGQVMRRVPLDVSFRSTAPVLALVDAVFAQPDAAAGVAVPGTLRHFADRAGFAGRVELWPTVPVPERAAAEWQVPERNLGSVSAMQRLADSLAEWIAAQTDGTTMLPSKGRPMAAGDVLVLLRRRNAFASALVRALKLRGVPVAGLDRLVLTDQPAVADLLSLCDALLLPQDDLTVACVLTSPLGGLSDDDLMALAPGRTTSLWEALRLRAGECSRWAAASRLLSTLFDRVDYASPHALLVEALGPLGGRARLLARLGPQAAEPVDELLNAALTYGATHPPSLQGFLHWLRQSGAQVKREADSAGEGGGPGGGPGGGMVRLMTVHGAKGLQAPLVILPDTTGLPPDGGTVLWATDDASGLEVPLWAPLKELRCAAFDRLKENASRAQAAEQNRLLYVALTRAEDVLLVCGWETRRARPEDCWYSLVERGFKSLAGVQAAPFVAVADPWPGAALSLASAQREPVTMLLGSAEAAAAALPEWAGAAPDWTATPPVSEPKLPMPLAPSRPEGAEYGAMPAAVSPLAEAALAARDAAGSRFRRGQLAHALLQHLPALPPADWAEAAQRYLAGSELTPAGQAGLVAEMLAVLAHPALAPLFGPDGCAEVPLAGVVAGVEGSVVVGGMVDRLAVLPDRVLLADYKTNRDPPAELADVPLVYLRQMAAYRAVLRGVFPDRSVHCSLVWTTGTRVMPLPDSLLDRHAPGAGVTP